jgi:hypothetical protein
MAEQGYQKGDHDMKTTEKPQTASNPTSQDNVNPGCDIKEDKDLMKTIWMFLLYKKRYS